MISVWFLSDSSVVQLLGNLLIQCLFWIVILCTPKSSQIDLALNYQQIVACLLIFQRLYIQHSIYLLPSHKFLIPEVVLVLDTTLLQLLRRGQFIPGAMSLNSGRDQNRKFLSGIRSLSGCWTALDRDELVKPNVCTWALWEFGRKYKFDAFFRVSEYLQLNADPPPWTRRQGTDLYCFLPLSLCAILLCFRAIIYVVFTPTDKSFEHQLNFERHHKLF